VLRFSSEVLGPSAGTSRCRVLRAWRVASEFPKLSEVSSPSFSLSSSNYVRYMVFPLTFDPLMYILTPTTVAPTLCHLTFALPTLRKPLPKRHPQAPTQFPPIREDPFAALQVFFSFTILFLFTYRDFRVSPLFLPLSPSAS